MAYPRLRANSLLVVLLMTECDYVVMTYGSCRHDLWLVSIRPMAYVTMTYGLCRHDLWLMFT